MVGNQLELADVVAEAEVGGGDDVAEHLGDPLDAVGGEPYSSAGGNTNTESIHSGPQWTLRLLRRVPHLRSAGDPLSAVGLGGELKGNLSTESIHSFYYTAQETADDSEAARVP